MSQIKLKFIPNKAFAGYDKDFNANHFFFECDCFLKDWKLPGTNITAGNLINHWSAELNLNGRLICASLQREQGLLSMKSIDQLKTYSKIVKNKDGEEVSVVMSPLDWALGCGVPDNEVAIQKYFGFEAQIKGAAYTYRYHFDRFKPGIVKDLPFEKPLPIQGLPENAATYSLLCYTPHIGAGELTAKLYRRYFGDYVDIVGD